MEYLFYELMEEDEEEGKEEEKEEDDQDLHGMMFMLDDTMQAV